MLSQESSQDEVSKIEAVKKRERDSKPAFNFVPKSRWRFPRPSFKWCLDQSIVYLCLLARLFRNPGGTGRGYSAFEVEAENILSQNNNKPTKMSTPTQLQKVANKPEDCKSPPWTRRQQRPDPARRPPPQIERNTAMGRLSSGQGRAPAVSPTATTRKMSYALTSEKSALIKFKHGRPASRVSSCQTTARKADSKDRPKSFRDKVPRSNLTLTKVKSSCRMKPRVGTEAEK